MQQYQKFFQLMIDNNKEAFASFQKLHDAYKEDPIAGLKLDKTTFKRIGALLAQTKLPRFAVLEGGYSEDLPLLVESFLDGFF